MKIPRKISRELELVLLDLKRARDFLSQSNIAICRTGGALTTTLHMQRKLDGAIFYEINKDIGSNLTGLAEGIRKIENLLAPIVEQ